MTAAEIPDLLAQGEALLAAMGEETRRAVAAPDALEDGGIVFIAKREELFAALEGIDSSIIECLGSCRTPELLQSLDRYRALRDATYTEVLELDKRLVELAQGKLKDLSAEFASLAHGKQAMNGYRPATGSRTGFLDREA